VARRGNAWRRVATGFPAAIDGGNLADADGAMLVHVKLAPALFLLLLAGCGSQGGTASTDAGTADAAGQDGAIQDSAGQDGATQDGNTGSEASTDGAAGADAAPVCTTAADCPSGQVCITHDECLPPPATPGCLTVACEPNPCAGQPLSCQCAGCGICSVDPDAGTITCSSGG
jgi:hypothetical protein